MDDPFRHSSLHVEDSEAMFWIYFFVNSDDSKFMVGIRLFSYRTRSCVDDLRSIRFNPRKYPGFGIIAKQLSQSFLRQFVLSHALSPCSCSYLAANSSFRFLIFSA